MSNSSFPLTLALCSQNIKKLFVPSFSKYESISSKLSSIQLNLFKICNHNIPLNGVNLQASELDFQLFRLHLPNYIPIGNWQANKFQLNRMRSYPINLIEVESNR